MNNWMRFLSLVLTAMATVSCSFLGPKTQTVQIWADEPDAMIWVNHQQVGRGKAVVNLPSNKPAIFKGAVGNRETIVTLDTELSRYGIMDLCGWWLIVPLSGFLSPGAWQLEQDVVPLHIPQ